ncbi:hypothetical protein ACFE04_019624 [Oxalis oulophora]
MPALEEIEGKVPMSLRKVARKALSPMVRKAGRAHDQGFAGQAMSGAFNGVIMPHRGACLPMKSYDISKEILDKTCTRVGGTELIDIEPGLGARSRIPFCFRIYADRGWTVNTMID